MFRSHRSILAIGLLAALANPALTGAASAPVADEQEVWVTTGEDVFTEIVRTPGILRSLFPPESFGAEDGVVITRLPERDLEALAAYIHATTGRCGGFIVHDSLSEATAALEAASRNRLAPLPSALAIHQQAQVQALLPLLDKANLFETIRHLSTSYNNRYYRSPSGQQAALWIRDLWQGYAAGRPDVTVTAYSHNGYGQPSIILTIPGATLPEEVVVLGAHLDSIRHDGADNANPATIAPGADDDASGIAVLSEAVRVLLANGFVPDRTIKFMGYAAEEAGLLGSGDIAAAHLAAGTNVVAVMQFDMTDFNGSFADIAFIDDFTNSELTSFAIDLVETYQPELHWTTTRCGYGCSDHASWHNRGFPTVFPFEAPFGQQNQAIHTRNDTLATLNNATDHALKFAKIAFSFAIEAGSSPTCSGGGPCVGAGSVIWMSFIDSARIPGIGTVKDEDVVGYDEGSGTWSLIFDGSDVGLSALEIDGLAALPGGDLLLSFTTAATLSGIAVDDSDVVRFTPTSLGATTAGAFSLYFDGSDVGLTTDGEDVDAIALAPNGRLIISTTDAFSGNGASGNDEDLFIFNGTLDSNTAGSFKLYFDGSDVGLDTSSNEDLDGAALTASGDLLFSTLGSFAAEDLSGNDEDVAQFSGKFGATTSGTFTMRLDLSALGIVAAEDVGSLHVVE